MNSHLTSKQLVRIAAVAFVVLGVVVAVIHSRRTEDAGLIVPLEPHAANTLAAELERCRSITSDDTATLASCRRVWGENRQRFFAPAKATLDATLDTNPEAPAVRRKNQDRVLPKEAPHPQSETR